jgi:hypothetical protein
MWRKAEGGTKLKLLAKLFAKYHGQCPLVVKTLLCTPSVSCLSPG